MPVHLEWISGVGLFFACLQMGVQRGLDVLSAKISLSRVT